MPKKLTQEEFIKRANKVHNGKYNYSKVEYINAHTKVCITCDEHGDFYQTPNGHLQGKGCNQCGIYNRVKKRRHSTEWFISKANETHKGFYDYSKVKYITIRDKVCIICPEHGEFWQKAEHHLSGCGCPKCNGKFMDLEFFKDKANKVHNNKYDYSKVRFINSSTKVCIICPIHGEFWQTPNTHTQGGGCLKCAQEPKITLDEFIAKAKIAHNNEYDYSLVEYKNTITKVKIVCPKHGIFEQKPIEHLKGQGCKHCSDDARRKTKEQFILEANKVHNNYYDYSMVDYKQSRKKIKIICPIHGLFEQTPHHHLEGIGCSKCSKSKGENQVELFLKSHKITYLDQYKIPLVDNLFEKNRYLRVDFFLPTYNIIIEFNGIQHYKEVKCFHEKDNGFEKQKDRDNRLRKWCKDNNIQLLEIKYNQVDEIEKILTKKLKLK